MRTSAGAFDNDVLSFIINKLQHIIECNLLGWWQVSLIFTGMLLGGIYPVEKLWMIERRVTNSNSQVSLIELVAT